MLYNRRAANASAASVRTASCVCVRGESQRAVAAKEGDLRCVVPTGTWCARATFAAAAALVASCSLMPERAEQLRIEEVERALLPMASVAVDTGQLETAQRLYRRLLDVSPESFEAHMGLGDVAFKNRRSEDAAQWYLGALALAERPEDRHQALLWHGRATLEGGQLESARRSFMQLTETREQASLRDLAWAFNGIGLTKLLDGDLDGAVAAMQRAVRQAPSEPMFAENLNRALGMLAEQQRAIGPQRRARSVAQSAPVALADLPAAEPTVRSPAPPSAAAATPAPRATVPASEQPRRTVAAVPAPPREQPPQRHAEPEATVQWLNEPSLPGAASAPPAVPSPAPETPPAPVPRPAAPAPAVERPDVAESVVAPQPNSPRRVDWLDDQTEGDPTSPRTETIDAAPDAVPAQADVADVAPVATQTPPVRQVLGAGVVRREGRQAFVEIGAFETFGAADAAAQRLAAVAGNAAHVVLVRSLYRVRIGPLTSEARLGTVVESLASQGYVVQEMSETRDSTERTAAVPSSGAELADGPPPRAQPGGFIVEEGGRRFLQLGAFGTQEAARELASDLRGRTRQPVLVEQVQRGAGTLHRVRIGPLANEQTVADLRAEMAAAGYAVE